MLLRCLFIASLLFTACQRSQTTSSVMVTASVAASLQKPMEEVKAAYLRVRPGSSITFNFGSSGALARQIQEGAPMDVFFSAAAEPMNELEAKGLLIRESRRDLLRNQLVLIAPKDSTAPRDFNGITGNALRLIALGEPRSVPAGEYGKQTLEALGLWRSVEPKLVFAKDVRQVLSYVETGNADAGLVYKTDAESSQKVRVVATAPEASHRPIVYPVAVLKESRNQEVARAFVQFLATDEAATVFRHHGFEVTRE